MLQHDVTADVVGKHMYHAQLLRARNQLIAVKDDKRESMIRAPSGGVVGLTQAVVAQAYSQRYCRRAVAVDRESSERARGQ